MNPIFLLIVMLGIGMIAGAALVRYLPRAVLYALWAICVVGIIWAIYTGRQQTGFDGIGYAILVFIFIGPFALGSMISALVLWWRARGQSGD